MTRPSFVDVTLDLVDGALNHRLFQGHAPLDDHFARAVVDIVVRGLGEVH